MVHFASWLLKPQWVLTDVEKTKKTQHFTSTLACPHAKCSPEEESRWFSPACLASI